MMSHRGCEAKRFKMKAKSPITWPQEAQEDPIKVNHWNTSENSLCTASPHSIKPRFSYRVPRTIESLMDIFHSPGSDAQKQIDIICGDMVCNCFREAVNILRRFLILTLHPFLTLSLRRSYGSKNCSKLKIVLEVKSVSASQSQRNTGTGALQ